MYMFCLWEIRWATVNIPPTTTKLLVSCLTLKSCTVHLHSCAGVIGAHHDRLSRGFYFMLDGLGSQGYLGVKARYLETASTGDGLSGLDYPTWRSFNRSSTARLFATFIKACQHKVDTYVFATTLSNWVSWWVYWASYISTQVYFLGVLLIHSLSPNNIK